jgi:hypothetical protein
MERFNIRWDVYYRQNRGLESWSILAYKSELRYARSPSRAANKISESFVRTHV